MSGIQIDAIAHKTDSCGSSKGLKVFAQEDGSVNGYCFACGTFVEDPYGEKKTVTDLPKRKEKTPEEIQAEIAEVEGYQTLSIPKRKLRDTVLESFGAKVSVSEKDGKTPTAIYWPVTKGGKLSGYHVKPLTKEVPPYNVGDTKDCDLLNWGQAKVSGAYKIVITEGPEDMASVQTFQNLYGDEKYPIAVASLPHGASSAKKSLLRHSEDLRRLFKDVILCFDDDDAGWKAVKNAMLVLPSAKAVTLPAKDANDSLIQGFGKAAWKAINFQSEKPKNTGLVFGSVVHDKAREPAKFGEFTWPWEDMNDALRGIRLGETIYVGAGVKMGKGEFRDTIAAHLMRNHDAKVFIASPEQAISTTYKRLAGKVSGRIFHDPKIMFDERAYDEAGEVMKERLALLDLYQHLGWESLKKDITAAAEWGAKAVFIDPITNLTNGVNSGDANTMLQGIAQEISALSLDLNIVTFLFCHLKAPEGNISADQRAAKYKQGKYIGLGNCPHELGGDVLSSQFAGSRAMMRSANLMIGLEGNKDPELTEEIRSIRHIRILEDREFGFSGKFSVQWNPLTGTFSEA